MQLKLSNNLIISGATEEQKSIIKKGLSLKNPTYDVMVRHHNIKALYVIKEFIKYYKETEEGIVVGRGVLPRLYRRFTSLITGITSDISTASFTGKFSAPKLSLRDYQQGCIGEILHYTEGIIKLDTGFGKTIIALKLIEETKLKTLIIVPRLSILSQFKQDLKKYYNYEPGIINGDKWDIKDVTIATQQTLKLRDLSDLKNEFGMVIFDECHSTISPKGIKLITSFAPLRLYGLSGTPDRSDGQGLAIQFYFGDVIIDRALPQISPKIQMVKCHEEFFGSEYYEIVESQSENINRNKNIANLAVNDIKDKRKILILTKRVKHYESIYNLLPGSINAIKLYSKTSSSEKKIQETIMERLREGDSDFDVILGTFSLLSTGVNIPALDTLIIAGDLKSEVLSRQSVGRILRLFEGKQNPKIIDIDDLGSGILHRQALRRRQFYKDNNWEII